MTVWNTQSKSSLSDDLEPETCVCKTDCIERPIKKYFAKHGRFIAKHPYPFFLIPLILSMCFGFGMKFFQLETDTEYLVTPKNGEAKMERKFIQKYFANSNPDQFLPDRGAMLDGFLDVIIVSQDGGHVLTSRHMRSIHKLNNFIQNLTAIDDIGANYNFTSICARWKRKCIPHPITSIFRDPAHADLIQLTYPKFQNLFIGNSFGQVVMDNFTGTIKEAKATRLTYYVKYETEVEQEFANRWFTAVTQALLTYIEDHDELEISIYHCATNSLATQFDEASNDIVPKFAAPFSLLILFSVVSCMMKDWVRSKPWLALLGVISAGLSLLTVFGGLSALRVAAAPQVGLVPFLVLGVGVDNMFILISAWRRSEGSSKDCSPRERVETRLAYAMQEAALSITITSLTDVLAFGIGAITQFRTVELFCLYTGLCIIVSYIYCVTFFAAGMVFSGWREEQNLHCFTINHVQSKQESADRNIFYRLCCAGGVNQTPVTDIVKNKAEAAKMLEAGVELTPWEKKDDVKEENKPEDQDHLIMKFFRDYLGPFLMKRPVKAIVVLVYIFYVIVAIWGCSQMRKGVSFKKLSNTDSYLAHYYTQKDALFDKYGPSVALVFDEPLEYSDPKVQTGIEGVIKKFENDTVYFTNTATVSWLRYYLLFLKRFPVQPKNEAEFVKVLKHKFLKMRGMQIFSQDIAFNEDDTKIIAARFYVQSTWFEQTEDTMLEARRLAKEVKDFHITIFHQTFVYFDQPVVVWANTLQNMIIAVICMFFVALLFVPHILCALWVTAAAASIEIGVIGCMTLWDVNVDFISMTYLILCIGFSVDFAVHITYGFIASSKSTPNEKAIDALYIIGYPIIQSGTSTILGIVFLCTSISYLFLSFFKTMILVIVFGMMHGIVFLPVFLSLLSCKVGPCPKDECEEEISKQKQHLKEKSRHICPGLFSECKDCDTVSADFQMVESVV